MLNGSKTIAAAKTLAGLQAIKIKMENGEEKTFNADLLLRVPDEPIALQVAARLAPADLAFWKYQVARAQSAFRTAEIKQLCFEGEKNANYRLVWMKEAPNGYVAEATIKSLVDCDVEVVSGRHHVEHLRRGYEIVRSVRDALEHRLFVVRKLLGLDTDIAD